MVKITCERVEPVAPECLVLGEPVDRVAHRFRRQRAGHDPAGFTALQEASLFQRAQVLHETGQRHVRLRFELTYRTAARLQCEEHRAPRRIGKGGERRVEPFVHILNHWV